MYLTNYNLMACNFNCRLAGRIDGYRPLAETRFLGAPCGHKLPRAFWRRMCDVTHTESSFARTALKWSRNAPRFVDPDEASTLCVGRSGRRFLTELYDAR